MRQRVADVLAEIGDTRSVEPLIVALRDDDEHVRVEAARALGKIGDARAMEPLVTLLDDKTQVWFDRRVCDHAYHALQKIGTPEALQACEDWVAEGNKPRRVS